MRCKRVRLVADESNRGLRRSYVSLALHFERKRLDVKLVIQEVRVQGYENIADFSADES